MPAWTDEYGILYLGIYDFLLWEHFEGTRTIQTIYRESKASVIQNRCFFARNGEKT